MFFRPVVLTVRDGGSQICVLVPPALVQKMLLNTAPDKLYKTIGRILYPFFSLFCNSLYISSNILCHFKQGCIFSDLSCLSKAPGSEVKFIQVVAERISSMLTATKNTFLLTVRSHFQCDENSIPIIQNFLLLDFSPTEA